MTNGHHGHRSELEELELAFLTHGHGHGQQKNHGYGQRGCHGLEQTWWSGRKSRAPGEKKRVGEARRSELGRREEASVEDGNEKSKPWGARRFNPLGIWLLVSSGRILAQGGDREVA